MTLTLFGPSGSALPSISIDMSMLVPGHAGGVEEFVRVLAAGMLDIQAPGLRLRVVEGTGAEWRRRIGAGDAIWQEVPELPMTGRARDTLKRLLPLSIRTSTAARHVLWTMRRHALRAPASTTDAPPHRGHGTLAPVVIQPYQDVPLPGSGYVLTVHDLRFFQSEFRSAWQMRILADNIARAAAVVVSWPHPYQEVLERFPAARDRTTLIPLPVFHPAPVPRPRVQREPDLLIYPANTGRMKNHENLLRAMTMLPDLRLVCPGPPMEPYWSRLRAQVVASGLTERVSFPGFVPVAELNELLARATAMVVPNRWDAASGPVFEAFSWGLPVACADVAPLRAQAAYVGADLPMFDPLNPTSIAVTIRRMLADREHHAAQSRRAGRVLAARSNAGLARDYAAVAAWVAGGCAGPVPRSRFVTGDHCRAAVDRDDAAESLGATVDGIPAGSTDTAPADSTGSVPGTPERAGELA